MPFANDPSVVVDVEKILVVLILVNSLIELVYIGEFWQNTYLPNTMTAIKNAPPLLWTDWSPRPTHGKQWRVRRRAAKDVDCREAGAVLPADRDWADAARAVGAQLLRPHARLRLQYVAFEHWDQTFWTNDLYSPLLLSLALLSGYYYLTHEICALSECCCCTWRW